ncbi:hypothetical protein DV515_00000143 [Chloebia gouldiae]|uniref:Uncharacterized protein n=1 Tax=Chloebia gouldiae TaxID=44316 RepID=A0A3L8T0P1_CHLGU|nr:hypothetical protein DV515_00000143 [Chloebia gouldiae]
MRTWRAGDRVGQRARLLRPPAAAGREVPAGLRLPGPAGISLPWGCEAGLCRRNRKLKRKKAGIHKEMCMHIKTQSPSARIDLMISQKRGWLSE